jgi:hypothetical protein
MVTAIDSCMRMRGPAAVLRLSAAEAEAYIKTAESVDEDVSIGFLRSVSKCSCSRRRCHRNNHSSPMAIG